MTRESAINRAPDAVNPHRVLVGAARDRVASLRSSTSCSSEAPPSVAEGMLGGARASPRISQASGPPTAPSAAIGRINCLSAAENKLLVRRLIEEAVAKHNVDALDELAAGQFAQVAKRWVQPFQSAFPDFEMKIVDLIGEGDTVVGHFKCSGTHLGEWLGMPPTGRRFEGVDEIYIFQVRDGKLISAFGVEDNLARLSQLGISPPLG